MADSGAGSEWLEEDEATLSRSNPETALMESADRSPQLQIRAATPGDLGAITALLEVLGYPADTEEVAPRLQRLLEHPDCGVLIADLDGITTGLATFQFVYLLEREKPQCRITALVTEPQTRRHGVARALVQEVEHRAEDAGCFRLEVTTQPERPDAIEFYSAIGFRERPLRLVRYLLD